MPATGIGPSLIGRVLPSKRVMGLSNPNAKFGALNTPEMMGGLPSSDALMPSLGKMGDLGLSGDPFALPMGNAKLTGITPLALDGAAAPPATPPPAGPPTTGGSVGSLGGEYSVLDQYNASFQKAAQQFGLPVNALKAIAAVERGWEGTSPSGAVGIMQVMPQYWGDKGYDIYSVDGNIMAGALAYKSFYDQYHDEAVARGMDPYEAAARAYLAGNPWSGASDAYGTTTDIYGSRFKNFYSQLGSGFGGSTNQGGTGGGASGVAAIWGGQGDYPITQDMGLTDFARGNSLYDYARAYHGFEGHPGLDIGTPSGTTLYTPVSGTVVFAGGSGYYANYGNAGPGVGEFRIRLDNGDELILGHMSNINVQAGQRINAGTAIGLSGGENGDHVHVEYRQADGAGGFYIVNPNEALGSNYVSTIGGGGGQGAMYQAPVGETPSQRARRILGGL